MSDNSSQPNGKPAGKGLRIALALSLTVNLAVVGMVAGAMLRDGPGGRLAMVRDLGFGPFSEALRPEDRKALRQALFDRAPEIRQSRSQMRDDTRALLAVLRADPFDPEALKTVMDKQHIRLAAQLNLGQDMMRALLVGLPAAERAAFADRLEERLRHGDGEDRGDKDGRDDKKD